MHEIFISYRRADGIASAKLLKEQLIKSFGKEAVFLDTTRLEKGSNFTKFLSQTVLEAKVVIAMIGPNWRGHNSEVDRLKDPEDWVRKELELSQVDPEKKVFPLLIKEQTEVSAFKLLPESLSFIASLNTTKIRELEFEQDVIPLIAQIEKDLDVQNPLRHFPIQNPGENKFLLPSTPFKGLDFFTEKDTRVFFGRGVELKSLLTQIIESTSQIILFYGYSGVGKSSMLFAGLKPRIEFQGWKVNYLRRDFDKNLTREIGGISQVDGSKGLLILDQMEEVFTNPKQGVSPQMELIGINAKVEEWLKKPEQKVILSFRKEHLAEIKGWLGNKDYIEEFLRPLSPTGILGAINGLNLVQTSKEFYQIEFEENEEGVLLSNRIAQIIIQDSEGNRAPFLQIVLRKMWDEVGSIKPRKFTFTQLNKIKSQSLQDLVLVQLSNLQKNFESEYKSGLLLEILFFFTTIRGTSSQHGLNSLTETFSSNRIEEILEALKNEYLLTEIELNEIPARVFRLSHDSLAPIIREMHEVSECSGQRASIILASKKSEIQRGGQVEFSNTDLEIIQKGRAGMREWSNAEEKEIKRNLEEKRRKRKEEKRKEEKLELRRKRITQISLAFLVVAIVSGIFFWNQYRESQEQLARSFWEFGKQSKSVHNYAKMAHLYRLALEATSDEGFSENLILDATFFRKHTSLKYGGNDEAYFLPKITANGKTIISSILNGGLHAWSVETGEGTTYFPEELIYALDLHPLENEALVSTDNGKIKLVNLDLKKEKHLEVMDSLELYHGQYHPLGKKILASDVNGDLLQITIETGRILKMPTKNSVDQHSETKYSLNGKFILTIVDQKIKIWDSNKGLPIKTPFEGLLLENPDFSPDSKLLSAIHEGKLKIWDLNSGKLELQIEPTDDFDEPFSSANNNFTHMGFSPKMDRIVSINVGKEVQQFSFPEGEDLSFWSRYSSSQLPKFSPDGNFLVYVQEGEFSLFDISRNQMYPFVTSSIGNISSFSVLPQNKLLSWDGYTSTIKLLNYLINDKFGIPQTSTNNDFIKVKGSSKLISRNGSLWIEGTDEGKIEFDLPIPLDRVLTWTCEKDEIKLIGYSKEYKHFWFKSNMKTGDSELIKERINTFTDHILNNDSTMVFLTGFEKGLVWNLKTGDEHIIEIPDLFFASKIFGPENNLLVWNSEIVSLYKSVTSFKEVPILGIDFEISGANFGIHGNSIYVWSGGEDLIAINPETGDTWLHAQKEIGTEPVFDAFWSYMIFWKGNEVNIFNNYNGLTYHFNLNGVEIKAAKFNRDGNTAIIYSDSGFIYAFSTRPDEIKSLLPTPIYHPGQIKDVFFASDNSSFVSVDENGTIRSWDLTTGEVIRPPINSDQYVEKVFDLDNSTKIFTSDGESIKIWDKQFSSQIGYALEVNHSFDEIIQIGSNEFLLLGAHSSSILNLEIDHDLPNNLFNLELKDLTGTELQGQNNAPWNNELWSLNSSQRSSIKGEYEKLAQKHFMECKYPKANWWAQLNKKKAKELRPEVDWNN